MIKLIYMALPVPKYKNIILICVNTYHMSDDRKLSEIDMIFNSEISIKK